MNNTIWDFLLRNAKPGELGKISPELRQTLCRLSAELTILLSRSDAAAAEEILSKLSGEILAHLDDFKDVLRDHDPGKLNGTGPGIPGLDLPRTPLSPEFIAWAKQDLNEEEILADIREIEETGGLQLADFIDELEQIVNPRE